MNKFLSLLLFSLTPFSLVSQSTIDSLWAIWNDTTISDTIRLHAMHRIAWDDYSYSYPDSAVYFAQMEYDLAEAKGLKKEMAMALNTQGVCFYYMSNYAEALKYHEVGLKLKQEIGDKKGISVTLGNIGNIYAAQGDKTKALSYYQRALKINEEIDSKSGKVKSFYEIGSVYLSQKEHQRALEYFQRSLDIAEEADLPYSIVINLIYIGNNYIIQKDYAKASEFYHRAMDVSEKIGDKNSISVCLNNLGVINKELKDYEKALNFYEQSLIITREMNDKSSISSTLNNIGILYFEKNDSKQALKWCQQGLQLAKEIGEISRQREACECIYNASTSLGNYKTALYYHEQMNLLDDSLKSDETIRQLGQFEFEKKILIDSIHQAEEKRQLQEVHAEALRAEEKRKNISLSIGGLILLIAGGLYSRLRFVRKSKAILQVEKDRSESLLLNILPAEIAAELKEKGRTEARDFDMVSILFSDFKGFTEQSAKLSASALVNEINHCFEAFDGIMEKHGIEKIKTIGDAYMAAGGLPVPYNNSVKNTLLAALEMQAFVSQRSKQQAALDLHFFEMRVGIHTGPVVAGIVGVKKFQYDLWGDTVNTASRMESNSEVGQVNISQETYEIIMDDPIFEFESRGKVEAKGKGAIEMYFVRLST